MRLPNAAHESHPWRIREIAPEFTLEDVWALPVHGRADEFQALIDMATSSGPADAESAAVRVLWDIRDRLGSWFGLGRISVASDGERDEDSLSYRLPDDLRDTAADVHFESLPFTSLYRTDDEFAAEISNTTMHGVMHVAWVAEGDGRYQGQMAVYVKPNGLFGKGYMAAIKPFRYWIVYPAMMRQMERQWNERVAPLDRAGSA
jgi:hypothetical protein